MSSIKATLLASAVGLVMATASASAQWNEKATLNGDYVPMATLNTSQTFPNGTIINGEYGKMTLNGNYVPSGAAEKSGALAKHQGTVNGEFGETTLNGDYIPSTSR
jgi:hypothetical protein